MMLVESAMKRDFDAIRKIVGGFQAANDRLEQCGDVRVGDAGTRRIVHQHPVIIRRIRRQCRNSGLHGECAAGTAGGCRYQQPRRQGQVGEPDIVLGECNHHAGEKLPVRHGLQGVRHDRLPTDDQVLLRHVSSHALTATGRRNHSPVAHLPGHSASGSSSSSSW